MVAAAALAACGAGGGPVATAPEEARPVTTAVTVNASCGVRYVETPGRLWVADPPFVAVPRPPGGGPSDPALLAAVPGTLTLTGPDRARLDAARLTGPVQLREVPAGSPRVRCVV